MSTAPSRSRPIRVAHFLEELGSGGVEQRRLQLVRRLSRDEVSQMVVCTEETSPIAHAIREAGAEVVALGRVRSLLDPGRYRRAAALLREWDADIAHGAIIEGFTAAVIGGRLAGTPVTILEETSTPLRRRWRATLLCRAVARLATACVGVSPAVGAYLHEGLGVPKDRIAVIPNGVERPRRADAAELTRLRLALGLPPDAFVVGAVGRLHEPSKRFSDLLRALALLRDLPVVVLFVGKGPDRGLLESLAAQLGVEDRVRFIGFQTDVGPYYSLMDVSVLSSVSESFGLVVAEAMRSAVPVVATAVGGVPSVVGDTGRLVPPRDPDALAQAVRDLWGDPDTRQRLGVEGQRRADALFSAERYVGDVMQLYRRLLQDS